LTQPDSLRKRTRLGMSFIVDRTENNQNGDLMTCSFALTIIRQNNIRYRNAKLGKKKFKQ